MLCASITCTRGSTVAPSCASSSTTALPIPFVPPVTRHRLPCRPNRFSKKSPDIFEMLRQETQNGLAGLVMFRRGVVT